MKTIPLLLFLVLTNSARGQRYEDQGHGGYYERPRGQRFARHLKPPRSDMYPKGYEFAIKGFALDPPAAPRSKQTDPDVLFRKMFGSMKSNSKHHDRRPQHHGPEERQGGAEDYGERDYGDNRGHHDRDMGHRDYDNDHGPDRGHHERRYSEMTHTEMSHKKKDGCKCEKHVCTCHHTHVTHHYDLKREDDPNNNGQHHDNRGPPHDNNGPHHDYHDNDNEYRDNYKEDGGRDNYGYKDNHDSYKDHDNYKDSDNEYRKGKMNSRDDYDAEFNFDDNQYDYDRHADDHRNRGKYGGNHRSNHGSNHGGSRDYGRHGNDEKYYPRLPHKHRKHHNKWQSTKEYHDGTSSSSKNKYGSIYGPWYISKQNWHDNDYEGRGHKQKYSSGVKYGGNLHNNNKHHSHSSRSNGNSYVNGHRPFTRSPGYTSSW